MNMQSNQFFSLKRFGKYASCSFITNYRQMLLFWGAIAFGVLAISLLNMKSIHSNWNRDGWVPLFLAMFYVGGLLSTGFAFSWFRSRERTIAELMIPVSTFERFLYEFLEKVVGFLILFPTIFYVSSSLAVGIRNTFAFGATEATVNGRITFPFETISFEQLSSHTEPGLFGMLFVLSILAFVLAFAGAATFRKMPLIKTIVFVGLVFLTGVGYFYLMLEKLKLRHPWVENLEHDMTAQKGFLIGKLAFATIALIALTYTYFKLKEKEAS